MSTTHLHSTQSNNNNNNSDPKPFPETFIITSSRSLTKIQDTKCGIPYIYQPKFLQIFTHRISVMLILSLAFILQQMISNGFPSVIFRTLEIRFNMNSIETGVLSTCYEIGDTVIAIFVIHIIQNWHKPGCIGFGLIIAGIGAIIFSLPHFLVDSYEIDTARIDASSFSATSLSRNNMNTENNNNITIWNKNEAVCPASLYKECDNSELENKNQNKLYITLFMSGLLLVGAGSVPIHAFVPTYIDENIEKEKVPFYHSVFFAAGILGPAFAFVAGGTLLDIHTDFNREILTPPELTSDSPIWVGAWWPGMLYGGIALCVISLAVIMLPRKFGCSAEKFIKEVLSKNSSDSNETNKGTNGNLKNIHSTVSNASNLTNATTATTGPGGNLIQNTNSISPNSTNNNNLNNTTLLYTIKHLFTNKIWVLTSMAICCDAWTIQIAAGFAAKYIALGFNLTQSQSALVSGGILIVSAISGYLAAGQWLKFKQVNLDENENSLEKEPKSSESLILERRGSVRNTLQLTASNISHFSENHHKRAGQTLSGVSNNPTVQTVLKNKEEITRKHRLVILSFSTVVGLATSFIGSFGFLINCGNTDYHGIDFDQISSTIEQSSNQILQDSTQYCTSESNNEPACMTCDLHNFIPVCDQSTQISFFSPCFAGCTGNASSVGDNLCECTGAQVGIDTTNLADKQYLKNLSLGVCDLCANWKLPVFCILMSICLFGHFWNLIPTTSILINGVEFSQRSQSLAFQSVITRVLGSIPGPILFGMVMDNSCVIWEQTRYDPDSSCSSSNSKGSCMLYDTVSLSRSFCLLFVITRIAASAILFYLHYIVTKEHHIAKLRRNDLGNANPSYANDMNEMRTLGTDGRAISSSPHRDRIRVERLSAQ